MAKFRQNHGDPNRRPGSGSGASGKGKSVKYIIWFLMIVGLMYLLTLVDTTGWSGGTTSGDTPDMQVSTEKLDAVDHNFLPESTTGAIITHKYYTLSYSEEHEQAEWVAYKLTKENLKKPRVPREKRFNPDKQVTTTSAYHNDYSHSGYTRGHLAPAGDMAWDKDAMRETFYMSNMSPQIKEFNGGIWRELEEDVRDWAYDNDELYIVSGPVLLPGHIITKIGRNEVSVPDLFYKIILDIEGNEKKAIAFLIPNEKSTKLLRQYAVTIDEVEKLLGIDFFADFMPEELEKQLEATIDVSQWKFDESRYKTRLEKWNNW